MDIKILVATHKNYRMPDDKQMYVPIFVGKSLHPSVNHTFKGDNTGDNISFKNANYNELTAIYWAWKNLDADAIGLVHYRRYLSLYHSKNISRILSQKDVEELLKSVDIILPKKRNYYIESNYDHYVHAHRSEPIDQTKKIISEYYPDYLECFNEVMKDKSAHMFNMFIMKRDKFNDYCEWLFDILRKLEQRIDISKYDVYEARVFGFVSELLLDVWLETNKYSFKEVNFVFMEKQNWLKKGSKFIIRKFKGKTK